MISPFNTYRTNRSNALVRLKANADRRAEELRPILAKLRQAGISGLRATAAELNRQQVPTPRHGIKWRATTVARLLHRLHSVEEQAPTNEPR